VDDQQRWQRAGTAVCEKYEQLPDDTREGLAGLVKRIMLLKEELLDLSLAAGSGAICRTCGGACCRNGKYHVSLLDLLAYRISGAAAVVPDFGKAPHCPYGGTGGCLMPPRFRPLTCVIFNCDAVEEQMGEHDRERFRAAEQELRDTVKRAEALLGFRVGRALLLSCDE